MKLLIVYMANGLPPSKLAEIRGIRYCNPNRMFEKVHILLPPDNRFFLDKNYLLQEGNVILHYTYHHNWLSNFNYLKVLFKAIRIIKTEKIDIIRAYNPHFCGLVGVLLQKLTGTPSVISIHTDLSTFFDIPGVNYLFRSRFLTAVIEKFSLRNASLILNQGRHMRTYLGRKYKIPEDRFHQIKITLAKPEGISWTPDPERFTVIFVGSHEEQKNLFCLLRAFKLFKSAVPQAQLWFAGEGSLTASLKSFVNSENIKDVTFFGRVSHTEVFKLLAQSHVFVHPGGKGEGFSNTILEAQSLGLPVVTTDIYPDRDYINDTNALIFKYDDASDCIKVLLNLFQDRKLFNYYSRQSISSARGYLKINPQDSEQSAYCKVLS